MDNIISFPYIKVKDESTVKLTPSKVREVSKITNRLKGAKQISIKDREEIQQILLSTM